MVIFLWYQSTRSAWVAWLYLPFVSLFAIALHLFMIARVEL
jgi:hypothetical protein